MLPVAITAIPVLVMVTMIVMTVLVKACPHTQQAAAAQKTPALCVLSARSFISCPAEIVWLIFIRPSPSSGTVARALTLIMWPDLREPAGKGCGMCEEILEGILPNKSLWDFSVALVDLLRLSLSQYSQYAPTMVNNTWYSPIPGCLVNQCCLGPVL